MEYVGSELTKDQMRRTDLRSTHELNNETDKLSITSLTAVSKSHRISDFCEEFPREQACKDSHFLGVQPT